MILRLRPSGQPARSLAERWQSGRMRRTRNAKYGQPYRGFESLPLRQSGIANFHGQRNREAISRCPRGFWRRGPNLRDCRPADFRSLNGFRLFPTEPVQIGSVEGNFLFSVGYCFEPTELFAADFSLARRSENAKWASHGGLTGNRPQSTVAGSAGPIQRVSPTSARQSEQASIESAEGASQTVGV